ncbi:CdaR family transcriptional regulator [Nocardia sp. XZ_19_385]|uniref:PucR family transcriptional regulator n=1 Tax=Nocardia sp. XZ_19_385 TaxID=2769488 RepID=UPI001890A460|nr:helix-turn-helix domain-containing protein [Nocardia sp. XZ_19_385]
MTEFDHTGTIDSDARRAELERLRDRAAALVGAFSADTQPYSTLPSSLMDADFVPSATLNVSLFFRFLIDDTAPTEEDTAPLVLRAVNLVHDGMPLVVVLHNYRVGIEFLFSQLIPMVEDTGVVSDIALRVTDYLGLIMSRITVALVDEARQPRWDLLERQREVVDALLTGREPAGWAQDPETPVGEAFLVAVVRLGEPTPGTLTGLRGRINTVPGTLLHRDSGGWTALVPMRPGDADTPAASLLSRLGFPAAQPHPELWIGAAAAPARADIPAAYAEAQIVAEVARSLRRSEIVCERAFMVFEYAIATSGPARPGLAAVLDPLDGQPALALTLDTFIEQQFNHNAVARTMFIHRNTVNYRLTRITDLTGHDPQQPEGIATLMAARVARRLEAKARS